MPTEDGFRRFRGVCPACGLELGEWMERCPECGQNLFEVYSGTFRPRRSTGVRVVALVLLLVLLGSLGVGLWRSCVELGTRAPRRESGRDAQRQSTVAAARGLGASSFSRAENRDRSGRY